MADIVLSVGFKLETNADSAIALLQKTVRSNPIKIPVEVETASVRAGILNLQRSLAAISKAGINVDVAGPMAALKMLNADLVMLEGNNKRIASSARAAGEAQANGARRAASAQKELNAATKEQVATQKQAEAAMRGAMNAITRGVQNSKRWTAAPKELRKGLADLENEAKNVRASFDVLKSQNFSDPAANARFVSDMQRIINKERELTSEAKRMGVAHRSFLGNLKGIGEFAGQLFALRQIFVQITRAMRLMAGATLQVDTAMTELKKVTDETDATYSKFLDDASSRAIKTGSTLADTINATADFARLGYTIDEASDLADAAIIYKNVGDGIENISDASESIISTMKAFNVEAENSMSIVDKYNEVGNNFAISSEGIGEAMKRSAASLAAANNSLDESIGLVTAANSVVQNPEKVGTTMKTVSMYLRAAKTEAEEAGITTDGMATSVSKLRDEMLALTNQKVDIMVDDNTFKSTFKTMGEIADEWDNLTDIAQARITEMLGGKRNANVVASLIENFDVAREAMETSQNAAGSATKENEKFLESIQGHLNVLKATFEEFSRSTVTKSLANGVLDLATNLLKAATSAAKLVQNLGGLKTVFAGLASFAAFQKGGFLSTLLAGESGIKGAFKNGGLKALMSLMSSSGAGLISIFAGVSAAVMGVVSAINHIKSENIKKEVESLNKAVERGNEVSKNITSISELINQYNELTRAKERSDSARGALSEDQLSQVSSIQSQLTELVGDQASRLDLVNGKIGEQKALLDGVLNSQISLNRSAVQGATDAAKARYDMGFTWTEDNKDNAKNATKLFKHLRKARGLSSYNPSYEEAYTRASAGYMDETNFDKYLARLGSYDNVLRELKRSKADLDEAMKDKDYSYAESASEDYRQLEDYIAQCTQAKVEFDEAMRSQAQFDATEITSGSGMKSQEEFQKWATKQLADQKNGYEYARSLIVAVQGSYPEYKLDTQTQKQLVTSRDDFVNNIIEGISSNPALSKEAVKQQKEVAESFIDKIISSDSVDAATYQDLYTFLSGEIAKGDFNLQGSMRAFIKEKNAALEAAEALSKYEAAYQKAIDAGTQYSTEATENKLKIDQARAESLRDNIQQIWDNADFKDFRDQLAESFQSTGKITGSEVEGVISAIYEKNAALGMAIDNTGASAGLLAKIFESFSAGADGIESVTGGLLALDTAINGPSDKFGKLTGQLEQWNSALSGSEYDHEFDSYTQAYKTLMDEFDKGTTGSRAFNASAELLFGEDLLTEWEWSTDKIKTEANKHKALWTQITEDGKNGAKNYTAQIKSAFQGIANAEGEIIGKNAEGEDTLLAKITGSGDEWKLENIDWSNIDLLAEKLGFAEGGALSMLKALQMTNSIDFSNTEGVLQAIKEMSMSGEDVGFTERNGIQIIDENVLDETLTDLGYAKEKIVEVKKTLSDGGAVFVNISDAAENVGAFADSLEKAGAATKVVRDEAGKITAMDISGDEFMGLAESLGWTKEEATGALDELSGMGNVTFDGTKEGIDDVKKRCEELEVENPQLEIMDNTEEATKSLETIAGFLDELSNGEWEIPVRIVEDTTGGQNMSQLKHNLEELTGSDVEIDADTGKVTTKVKEAKDEVDSLPDKKDVDVDVDAETDDADRKLNGTADKADKLDNKNPKVKADATTGSADAKLDNTSQKADKLDNKNPKVNVDANTGAADSKITDVENKEVGDKTTTINAVDNASSVISSVKGQINAIPSVKNVTISVSTSGVSAAVDAIKRAASAGGAKAGGTNSAPRGRTLVGELGPELVRDDDMYYLVGQNGPEFVNMRGGEQIFTAEETKKIYRRNGAKNKSGRAYANGIRSYHENRSYSPADNGFDKKEKDNDDKSKSWFEQQYELHSHLVKMNAETDEAYLNWLNGAYKQAYNECLISLEDFHKYQEEVYSGLQDLFEEYLDDMEHDISVREHFDHESQTILKSYQTMISEVEKEIASARQQGLKDTDDYVQKLQDKWIDYTEAVKELREDVKDEAKDAFEELIEFRIDMIEKETDKSKDELDKRLDALTEFYDKQREMLEDQRDEEDYLKEQAEKRKAVADIEEKLEQISLDNSAWANKRRIELQQDLMDAREELEEFERDHAYDLAIDNLDKMEEAQKAELDKETEALEKQYETQKALRMAAVQDIKNGNKELYEEMIEWNNKYGSGIEEDITEMWEKAYVAAQKYNEAFNKPYAIDTIDLNIGGKTMSFPINAGISNVTGYKDPMGTYNNSPIAAPKQTAKPAAPAAAQKSAPPSLNKGSYVSVKPGTRWYADSYGGGSSGTARAGTIKYVNLSGSHPYNIEGLGWVRKQDIVGYATGTRKAAAGLHSINEKGEEYIFTSPSNGTQYKMFSGGEKVLNARATEFLYDFANTGGKVLAEMVKSAIATAETNPLASVMNNSINLGDIIVNGSADNKTVSEIRRAQRQNLDFVLRELNKLQKT